MDILLVEDDVMNQKVAMQFLTKWGIQVTIANDGSEAIDALQQKKFNLILMDINMPGMDGCEATQNIRASTDPYFKTVPILAYTASSMVDTKEKAELLGMNDYVSKPLNPEEMHWKINHYTHSGILGCRPLKVRFDLFADSDTDFKAELITLLISNIKELQHASYRAYYTADARTYQNISNKVKSTLILLDDDEFTYVVDDLKYSFNTGDKPDALQQKIKKFNLLGLSIIKTLDNEIGLLKSETQ